MGLNFVKTSTIKRDPIPAGVKLAVCCGVIDLGVQETKWKGKPRIGHRVMIIWELPKETIETDDGPVPRAINKQYTVSFKDNANLTKLYKSWFGKSFADGEAGSFRDLLGQGCLLGIVHNTNEDGDTFANVDTVMGLPEGMEPPKPTHLLSFDFDDPDALETLEMLPEWIQNKVKASPTYAELVDKQNKPGWESLPASSDEDDDDLPF